MSWLSDKFNSATKYASGLAGSITGGDLLSAGTAILGGFSSAKGVAAANDTNIKLVKEQNRQAQKNVELQNASAKSIADSANALSSQQAINQMHFQKGMSDTAHQREIADLRAAGLNPILSGTGGMGASSPAGAQGSVTAAPVAAAPVESARVVDQITPGINSALSAMKTFAEVAKTNADRDFVRDVQSPATQQSTSESRARESNIQTDTLLKHAQTTQSIAYKKQIQQFTENLKKQGISTDLQNKILNSNVDVAKQAAATARNQGKITQSEYGYILDGIERLRKLF